VGEWNITQVTKEHKPFLAIQLHSIWPLFESRFQVNYSRQSIEGLIRDRGGITGTNQRFVKTKDAWKDYEKALNQYEMGTGKLNPDDTPIKPEKPRKAAVSKCAMIPASVMDLTIGTPSQPVDNSISDNFSEYESPAWEPIVVENPVNPEDIQPGTIATLMTDYPDLDLVAGDEVEVVGKQQSDNGKWFASVFNDPEKRFSVWIDELQVHKPEEFEEIEV
jgi:hypothetical protein